jgi:hypothetical protein
MMTTRQLLALLNSHIEGDEDQFLSVALQIAAQHAREGKPDDAEKLKRLVQKARDQRSLAAPAGGQTPIPMARPRAELQGLVESTYPKTTLAIMVLAVCGKLAFDLLVMPAELYGISFDRARP